MIIRINAKYYKFEFRKTKIMAHMENGNSEKSKLWQIIIRKNTN